MRVRPLSTMAGALLGIVLGLTTALPAAQAAPDTTSGSTATVGRLVLEPTVDRGYRGTLPIEVTHQGTEPAQVRFVITEPIRHTYKNPATGLNCYSSELLPDGRSRLECAVPGEPWQPGETRSFELDFEVLTAPQAQAMKAAGGRVAVKVDGTVITETRFRTLFRSTTGSLRDPVPYVRDLVPDASITVGDATMVRQPDGSWLGRMPVTVRYASDAAHTGNYLVEQNLPAGVWLSQTDPFDGCAHFCVPGGEMMEGEVRTFDALLVASAETTPTPPTQATLAVETYYYSLVADAVPSDNSDPFTVTFADAS
ncbi:hypothetical protein [Micromonospora cathayae]|uniref:Uncharacterized protein n=1 Tax=Micromonospora cathayae TaxID=3028804 RepID=A0ABY7ZNR3_9ACTN|nr:hypothetical protein [Micromonospora sp. HUAS 3]WDZ84667.1 hypothetical protein PVK37_30270 [Micromonospora sp. HUAS 3]